MNNQKKKVPSREYIFDPTFVMQPPFLSEPVYNLVLQACVICCTDILFVNSKHETTYLFPRKVHPFHGWWLCGGRIPAGTPLLTAAVKKIRSETGLTIAKERLTLIAIHRYIFPLREQEPQNTGSDSMAWTYALEPTQAELDFMRSSLDPKEYEDGSALREFTRDDLIRNHVYQEIIDLYDTVFPR